MGRTGRTINVKALVNTHYGRKKMYLKQKIRNKKMRGKTLFVHSNQDPARIHKMVS